MVEEMLAARGISVTHETIRQWGLKFGREFANRIRQRAPRRGDKWHLDEVVISIAEKKHWLWRAVDRDGFVLDVLVQSRRDKEAAKRLFRKLLNKLLKKQEEAGSSPSCARHRQAQELRRGEAGDHARDRASTAQGPQ